LEKAEKDKEMKQREDLYEYIFKSFSGLDRSYMGEDNNPYDLPVGESNIKWEELEESGDLGKYEEELMEYNRKKVMEEISMEEVSFLLQLKTKIEEEKIGYMDEENMSSYMPMSYFVYGLKGKLMINSYR
jgi:hypothetical protein